MHIYNQAQLFEAVAYRTQALDTPSTATMFPVRYSLPFSFSCFFFHVCMKVSLRVVYCGPSSHLIHLSCLLFFYHFITLVFCCMAVQTEAPSPTQPLNLPASSALSISHLPFPLTRLLFLHCMCFLASSLLSTLNAPPTRHFQRRGM